MNISVTKASKEWGVSRTTIYQKINDGELSRTADKKIDTSELFRVFGEPASEKRTEQLEDNQKNTHSNSNFVQSCTVLEHQLELERLKNEHLHQQINDQKQLIEICQQQISHLNKTLEKANASIHDFAQLRLLEFKDSKPESEARSKTPPLIVAEKKSWWKF